MGLRVYRIPQPGEGVPFKPNQFCSHYHESPNIDFDSVEGVCATCTSPPSESISIGIVNKGYKFTLQFKPLGRICVQENGECKGEFQGTVGEIIVGRTEIQYVVEQEVVHTTSMPLRYGDHPWRIFKHSDACELDVRWVGTNKNQRPATLFGSFNFEIINKNKETLETLELFTSALPRNCFVPAKTDFSTIIHPDLSVDHGKVFETHFFASVVQSKPLILEKGGLNPWAEIGELPLNPSWNDVRQVVQNWLRTGHTGHSNPPEVNAHVHADIETCIV